jgi:adenosylcobinamide-phosphate synthase
MRLEYQILLAVLLDLLLGDPRRLPHPVRLIGRLAGRLETVTRAVLPARAAGIITALVVIAAAGGAAWGLVRLAGTIHPYAAVGVRIVLIYTTLAARDLARHSTNVYRALAAGDLPEARKRVSLIVGRDTADLDERDVTRAAVESVAESIVDGVTAPLFFAVIAGPVGAIIYRAINTLDSMFGYKNERYLRFGWASARLDDAANFIPARLTAPLICLAAWLLRRRAGQSWKVLRRDARNHTSPNSGFAEAAVAGALGVRLGGLNRYFGKPSPKPTIGDPLVELEKEHIPAANALMFAGAGCCLAVFLAVRVGVLYLWAHWGSGR